MYKFHDQIDVHMNSLEECFYRVLTHFILLHKNTCLLKEREQEQNFTEYVRMVSVNAVTKKLL